MAKKAKAKAGPIALTHRQVGKGSPVDRLSKWNSGELIVPSPSDCKLLKKGDRVLLDGVIWKDASGPMLTGIVGCSVASVEILAGHVEIAVEIIGAQQAHAVEFFNGLADPHGAPMTFCLHFCRPSVCPEIVSMDFRFHVPGIRLATDSSLWNSLTPIGSTLPGPTGRGSENVSAHLQQLANDLGFKVNNQDMELPSLTNHPSAPSRQPALLDSGQLFAPATTVIPVVDRKSLGAALQQKMQQTQVGGSASLTPPPLVGGSSSSQVHSRHKVKKKKKKRKHKDKKRHASSSSDEASSTDSSTSSLSDPRSKFRRIAEQKPGQLFLSGLKEIIRLLENQLGVLQSDAIVLRPIFVKYYNLVMKQSDLGARGHRESLTLCTIMDHLLAGQTQSALDVAMQRLKAIESTGGVQPALPWSVATHMELVQLERPSTLNLKEQHVAAKQQAKELKLQKLLASTSTVSRSVAGDHQKDNTYQNRKGSFNHQRQQDRKGEAARRVSFRSPLRENPPPPSGGKGK